MILIIALVIGDASPEGISPFVSEDPEVVRTNLIEFYNQAVEDGGLDEDAPLIEAEATIEDIVSDYRIWMGRTVVLLETDLLPL
jgi:hypothetical protein